MASWTLSLDAVGLFGRLRGRRSLRPPAQPAAVAPAADPRATARRRSEAMRGLFPKLSAWMAHRQYLAEVSEVDRYLSRATDLADLERRIAEAQRRIGTAPRFP